MVEVGLVRKIDIDHEMQQSYLDYAMSVIVSRALPDARDGLKPVQRRILYAMYDMGLRPDSAFKKSARIVGEVLGKYHPHGDVAVYEAMARLAQSFSMRYQLVDGQGNFGSVDGDPPAAMRYTEARLTNYAIDLLAQLDRNTVNFARNFDDTLSEPEVLPAAIPNLLVNGASGIAVGMATNIPPHNLGEVIDALIYMLQQWEHLEDISVADLVRFIQGPDLPTGGIILQDHDRNDLLSAYGSGRGRVILRGRVHLEEMGRGRDRIIITELPYQVNKSALIERIAELAREGNLDGIADLRDESDRQGMRIVIELKSGADEQKILRELYRRTPMETTLSLTLLALVEGEPRLLTLKQALRVYLEHRLEVIRRRSEYDLAKARQRAHILEGLRVAINNLDEIIALIRNAPDVETAHARLVKKYKLSDAQAQAILDLMLRRLAALERKKIEQEYKELQALIKELEGLLKSQRKMRGAVELELTTMRQNYTDRRRTQIVSLADGEVAADKLTTTDLTPEEVVWVGIMEDGTIARTSSDELPRLSGRQATRWLLRTNTHHTLYLVGKTGRAAAVAVHALPETEKFGDGVRLNKVSPFDTDDSLAAIFSIPERMESDQDRYILTVTKLGLVKKSLISELPGPSAQGFVMSRVNAGDELGWAFLTDGNCEVLLLTELGMMIRFSEQEVRPMGLVAAGVNGIKLETKDRVAAAERISGDGEILFISSDGLGWRIDKDSVPLQGRYGQGVLACKLSGTSRLVGVVFGKRTQNVVVHFRQAAAKMSRLDEISLGKRLVKAQELAPVKSGDSIVALTTAIDGLAFWTPATKPVRKARRAPVSVPAPSGKLAVANMKTSPVGSSEKTASSTTTGSMSTVKPKPVTKPKTNAKAKSVAKPTAKPATVPATKPAEKPAAKPAAKPAGKPAGKPTARPKQSSSATDIPSDGAENSSGSKPKPKTKHTTRSSAKKSKTG